MILIAFYLDRQIDFFLAILIIKYAIRYFCISKNYHVAAQSLYSWEFYTSTFIVSTKFKLKETIFETLSFITSCILRNDCTCKDLPFISFLPIDVHFTGIELEKSLAMIQKYVQLTRGELLTLEHYCMTSPSNAKTFVQNIFFKSFTLST